MQALYLVLNLLPSSLKALELGSWWLQPGSCLKSGTSSPHPAKEEERPSGNESISSPLSAPQRRWGWAQLCLPCWTLTVSLPACGGGTRVQLTALTKSWQGWKIQFNLLSPPPFPYARGGGGRDRAVPAFETWVQRSIGVLIFLPPYWCIIARMKKDVSRAFEKMGDYSRHFIKEEEWGRK